MHELCGPTGNSAKLATMSTDRHTRLPRVFKQADKCSNKCAADGPPREWRAARKPADRNQLRVSDRREVCNVHHDKLLIERLRAFPIGGECAGIYGVERTYAADQQLQRIAAWVRPLRPTNSRKLRLVTNARRAVRVLIATASRNRDIFQYRGHLQGELGKVQARLASRHVVRAPEVGSFKRAGPLGPAVIPYSCRLVPIGMRSSAAMVVTTYGWHRGRLEHRLVSPTNTGTSEWKLRSAQEQQIGGPCQLIPRSKR